MSAPAWTTFTPEDRAITYRSGASHDMVCYSIREAAKLSHVTRMIRDGTFWNWRDYVTSSIVIGTWLWGGL